MAGLAPHGGDAPGLLFAPSQAVAPHTGLAPSLSLPPSSGAGVLSQFGGGSSGGWRVTTDPYQYSIVDDTITVYEAEDEEALLLLVANL